MTHLRIEQSTSGNEYVTSNVIHKLYETAKGILDEEALNEVEESQVSLQGSLVVPKAYGDEIDWLETKFPDLHITASARYIRFADDAVYARLSLYLGDGTGITSSEITNTNIFSNTTDSTTNNIYFTNNTSITLFNELGLLSQVVDIPLHAFGGCSNLISIDLSNILTVGTLAFLLSGLSGLLNLSSIRNIGNNAFGETNITSVVLGSNLQTIQEFAFNRCYSLTSVTGLLNVTFIPLYCFYMDSALQSVDLSSCTTIGSNAFNGCTLLSTIDTSNVTSIGQSSFLNCTSLTSVDLSNCTTIGGDAFNGCTGLTTINLSNCTSIGSGAFCLCSSLTSVILGNNITNIPEYAFGKSGLTSVSSNYVTTIGRLAFLGCPNLHSVDFPNVTSINDEWELVDPTYINMPLSNKLPGLSGTGGTLTDVVIPQSVTVLKNNWAWYYNNLQSVKFQTAIPPTLGTKIVRDSVTIYVPSANLSDYLTAYPGYSSLMIGY